MSGELIETFRRTLAKIAEIERRMLTDQVELDALRGEVDELRTLLRPEFSTGDADTQTVKLTYPPVARKRPIRDGSSVGYAKRVLRMAGAPMYVDDIINNIEHMTGLPVNKSTLVSNLSRYVKAGDTFKRTAANTFALINYDTNEKEIRLVG